MRGAVEDMMERLRLPINVTKTRSMRVPDEPLEFLGYRIGRNYRQDTGRAYIGTCPSRSSVVSACRRISELTHRRYGLLDQETVVRRLNRAMTGWANYFQLGQVSPAYRAVDAHAIRRLRQWLCRKHKVRAGKYVRFPDKRLWNDMGWVCPEVAHHIHHPDQVPVASRAQNDGQQKANDSSGIWCDPHGHCNHNKRNEVAVHLELEQVTEKAPEHAYLPSCGRQLFRIGFRGVSTALASSSGSMSRDCSQGSRRFVSGRGGFWRGCSLVGFTASRLPPLHCWVKGAKGAPGVLHPVALAALGYAAGPMTNGQQTRPGIASTPPHPTPRSILRSGRTSGQRPVSCLLSSCGQYRCSPIMQPRATATRD